MAKKMKKAKKAGKKLKKAKTVKKAKKLKKAKKPAKKVKKAPKKAKKAKPAKKAKAMQKPAKKVAAKKPVVKAKPMAQPSQKLRPASKPIAQPAQVSKPILPMRQPMQTQPTAGKAVKISLPRPAGDRALGIITHYYDRIGVGVLKLAEPLKIGDMIRVQKGETIFTQTVRSMQINRKQVTQANANDDVAIKVDKPAHEGARIYRV